MLAAIKGIVFDTKLSRLVSRHPLQEGTWPVRSLFKREFLAMDNPHIKSLPYEFQEAVTNTVLALKETLLDEAGEAFSAILSKHEALDIYSLSLYYSAGSWSYIFPTFSSEQGLEQVAQSYLKHSPLPLEQQKISLRWSPCDSPHHSDSELETMLPKTEEILDELQSLCDMADPDAGTISWPEDENDTRDKYYELISEVHALIHDSVIDVLAAIARTPTVADYRAKHYCVISLSAGDLGEEEFLEDVRTINGNEMYQSVRQELSQAGEIHNEETLLWEAKLKHEEANPPSTDLTVGHFQDIIDSFCPTFKTVGDGIFVAREGTHGWILDSAGEEGTNRFALMELLKESPHFDELDRLYGHFMGNNFAAGDLLPSIGRAFVARLESLLLSAFPDGSFYIFLSVDRFSLYRFSFWQNRQNGFTPWLKMPSMDSGVAELHCIGALPASVKIPCNLFREQGRYVAQAYGFPYVSIDPSSTEKQVPITASSNQSHAEALHELSQHVCDYLDSAFALDRLNFNEIEYPEAELNELESKSENLPTAGVLNTWQTIDVFPKFLTHYLVPTQK